MKLVIYSSLFLRNADTSEIYTLSLHDALPISRSTSVSRAVRKMTGIVDVARSRRHTSTMPVDRKSTRLNSSHVSISYAVFCLKKKKYQLQPQRHLLVTS